VSDASQRTEAPHPCDPQQERQNLDGNEKEKESPADGSGSGQCFLRAKRDPPKGERGTHRASKMQEQALPGLRAQVCAVAHLESGLDAEEEEMGVTNAKQRPDGDLDRGLNCNRENDCGRYDQAGVYSSQTCLKHRYTSSNAKRFKY
jgi:hypothetical protein